MAFVVASGLVDQLTDDPTPSRTSTTASELRNRKNKTDKALARGETEETEYWFGLPLYKVCALSYSLANPQGLGDVLEAIFGAILDDSDFDPRLAIVAYETHVLPFIRTYAVPPREQSYHPRSEFLRMLDTRACRGSIKDVTNRDGEKENVSVVSSE